MTKGIWHRMSSTAAIKPIINEERVAAWDLAVSTVRELNQWLHHELPQQLGGGPVRVDVRNPAGRHSLAAGVNAAAEIFVRGHAGYFAAGMNQLASVTIEGNAGWSVAENMMSGRVVVRGNASQCAGASAHGGLLVIHGDASSRCGISLKGADIVVGGSVGHMSAFMAQAGTLVVCGDAGIGLGDSLYEATIYVGGEIAGLGADARIEPMTAADRTRVSELLSKAGHSAPLDRFKRVASARTLYHWHEDSASKY
jgi:glutamate synthase domain-containing protein 3